MNREEKINNMKKRVFEANLILPQKGLVKLTWGNVSEIDRNLGVIVIKPSGVSYESMTEDQMVVTDLNGHPLSKDSLNPSSDLMTHVILYKHFEEVQSIIHTHSKYAVNWAQTGRSLPVYGTTHADAFYGPVPNTRQLTEKEVLEDYELNTGKVIIETFDQEKINPLDIPGVLVNGHGPFTWGKTVEQAVEHAIILDEICDMAISTELIMEKKNLLPQFVLDKHYFRKHGAEAYYGQK